MQQPDNSNQYLPYIYAYRDQINRISQFINSIPQWELVSDYERVKTIELQIADVINNLRTFDGTPLGKKLNISAVLKHLYNARNELNSAAVLAKASNSRTKIACFEHITKCIEYLNLAQGLMAPRGG